MEKNEFIEHKLKEIGTIDEGYRANTIHQLLGVIYDEIHGNHELKVKRSDAAKEFDLIEIKKDGDVGYDLPAILEHPIAIYPGQLGVIPTGIFLEIPKGWWASIEARSSTSKNILIVPKGVIDEGYRGELFAVVLNVGREKKIIQHGDRVVQLILHKRHNQCISIREVDELSPSERGDTGFGSTGVSAKKE